MPRPTPLTVTVTPDDVAQATSSVDPVTVALRRQYSKHGEWRIGLTRGYLNGEQFVLPFDAKRMLEQWDDTGRGYPVTFNLYL